jgi:hypothetical protein
MFIGTSRSEASGRELGFDVVATYLAAVTAGLGLLALLMAVVRRRPRRRDVENIFELDGSGA